MTRTSPQAALDTLAQRIAIEELNAAVAYCLDHAAYAELGDLFAAHARYANGPRVLEGRAAIVQSFAARVEKAGVRTTRHMGTGLRLQFYGTSSARGHGVWISYACNAPPPTDQVTPFMVADFDDVYVCEHDGHWRIAERLITPVFRNPQGAPAA